MLKEKESGQAIIEIIPAFFLFILVITASVSLFEVLRNATLVQETARNMAFAKIANSGTITSPPEASGALVLGVESPISLPSSNPRVSASNSCFNVYPTAPSHSVTMLPILGVDGFLSVAFATKLSVYRNTSRGAACQSF